jgi:hypothetical protein
MAFSCAGQRGKQPIWSAQAFMYSRSITDTSSVVTGWCNPIPFGALLGYIPVMPTTRERGIEKFNEKHRYRRRKTMKTIVTLLSALALLSTASVVSAEPTYDASERTFWENQSLNGQ